VHGNTTLEIAWTVIPALILAVIAVPTVRTIFKTQATARADALQVEVIGHQWWWEFRYPQYKVVTANELYLPVGRTVNFTLHSADVIHSFWVPALSGKRDLMQNRTNYLWFTPDSSGTGTWNGVCVEYCGTSHANMRFRTFTVSQADFESWAAHQQLPATGTAPPSPPAVPAPGTPGRAATPTKTAAQLAAARDSAAAAAAAQAPAGFLAYPIDKIPEHAIPHTPLPAGLTFDDNLKGDPSNGAKLVSVGACIGCHRIAGVPTMLGVTGPNLTHVASRTTIAAGLYPNDAAHLARWVKNARLMKPGILMPTLGMGETDPISKMKMSQGAYTDQQIADIVAYLQTLK
jgi:cytochrome c oxidase subunit II